MKSLIVALVLAFSVTAFAQEKPAAKDPVLSDADKQAITEVLKQRGELTTLEENFRLKAELTRRDLEKVTATLQQLINEKTPEGFQLNDKLELVKKPKEN